MGLPLLLEELYGGWKGVERVNIHRINISTEEKMLDRRRVRIIETCLATDSGQDLTILSELICMAGFKVESISVDGRTTRDIFIESLLSGNERYIHVSAHGDYDGLYIHGNKQTHVGIKHLEDYVSNSDSIKNKPLKGRFLTVSACGDPSLKFWQKFHEYTDVCAIVVPMGEVGFAESAIFYTSFYFALLRHPESNKKQVTSQRLINFVDTFQRTKGAYLSIGGYGGYRLCFWSNGDFKEII